MVLTLISETPAFFLPVHLGPRLTQPPAFQCINKALPVEGHVGVALGVRV